MCMGAPGVDPHTSCLTSQRFTNQAAPHIHVLRRSELYLSAASIIFSFAGLLPHTMGTPAVIIILAVKQCLKYCQN
jgi:hypothetical protein